MKNISKALMILRTLMSEQTHDSDNPFRPILFRRLENTDTSPDDDNTLTFKGLYYVLSDEEITDKLKSEIAQFSGAPSYIAFPDNEIYEVRRVSREQALPLENKIAVVTGAAGAIGAGICKGLMEQGCWVAAADISQENLDSLLDELRKIDEERCCGILMDVTKRDSVVSGFGKVIRKWGGLDILVANAGIAHVASLMEMELEDFQALEKVNIEGTLLTIAEAGRVLCRQNMGGDIILISTKNVFAPGAQFGAYSASKAASHQLARIASLEYAPFGIRVNMVAPDAVFSEGERKSGLWQMVGPSRMKARGLSEKQLEEYYQNRNLLKAKVTPRHVANAVIFFATHQTPTTGATIPVDGGLPDSTPR